MANATRRRFTAIPAGKLALAILLLSGLTAVAQSNGVFRQVYTNIAGSAVTDLTGNAKFPNAPDVTNTLTVSFEAPTDTADNYGQRCRALITAPTTGNYVFWIASDDASTLYLSTDETPANRQAIAAVTGWTSSREWTKEAGQQSAPQALVAGQQYYIEALMKEGNGGDNLAVRWQLPGGALEEPIPASRLVPFNGLPSGPPNITQQPTNTTAQESSTAIFRVKVSNQDPLYCQWQRNSNNIAGATNYLYSMPVVSMTNNGAWYRCILSNAFGVRTSLNARLTVTADALPPTLVSAVAFGHTGVRVTFSEPLLATTATNKANFVITNTSGTLAVSNAQFGASQSEVVLTTVLQSLDSRYTITVNGVRDASATTNLIAANSQIAFTNRLFTTGYIKRERYDAINGTAVTDLTGNAKYPNSPDVVDYPGSAGWPIENISDNYGARLSGFLVPPVSGTYTFAIRSDDASRLYLSTNELAAGKAQLTEETGCCTAFDAHVSQPLTLVAGQRYYLEALMKEGGGGDYLHVAWKTPWDNLNWNVIPGDYLGSEAMPGGSTISILQPPTNTSVVLGLPATFSVSATGYSTITTNLTFQWQVDGIDIPGANSASYTIPAVAQSQSNQTFRVVVSIPGLRTVSSSAVLTVLPDTFPPTIARVFNIGTTNVQVTFSEPVEVATATNKNNYVFVTGPTVSKAVFGLDTRTIVLTTTALTYGSNYTIRVSNVRDRATNPNTIAPNSPFAFTAAPYAPQDIGGALPAGTFAVVTNGYNVSAGGAGVGAGADQFQFSYEQRTGDFDVRVRVQLLSLSDVWAKAGLMARETLDASSRFAASFATPSISGTFFQYRDPAGAAANMTGNFPVNYPNMWVRLKRVGNVFTGYASYEGTNWTTLGTATIVMPSTIYFGMAASGANTNQAAVAEFRDLGTTTGAVLGSLAVNFEPLGPSSRKTGLVISEIMYKPAPRADTNNYEFVELFNSNPWSEDIGGYRLSGDVDFAFPPGTAIPGGGFIVIAKQPVELQALYGLSGVTVFGPYADSLKVPGTVRLRNKEGSILLEVNYADQPPWPIGADGAGHSLVLARPSYGEGYARAWDISDAIGGSPGRHDGFRAMPQRAVVINEFLAHTDPPLMDFIELYNHGNTTVNLAGCVLTDDPDTNKYVIPAGTTIPARGFRVFYETNLGFGLSSSGERIFFKSADLTRVLDAVDFEPQANGVSMGRWPDGAAEFYPLTNITAGASNSAVLIHNVVINEIMYDPISGLEDDEYVELYNKGAVSIDLGAWQFTSGIDFTFPSNTVLNAGAYLVVAKNPARLVATHPGLSPSITLGPFSGSLSGSGERLALAMPDQIITTNAGGGIKTNTIHIVATEVTYANGGRWGQWANGGGSSLELINPRANPRLAANWADSDESAKATWTTIETTGVLDNGGGYPPDNLQVTLLDAGECLLDDVEVFASGGGNLMANANFESGLGSWFPQGDHVRSSLGSGLGNGGGNALVVRATARGDTGANRVRASMTSALTDGQTATIRAKVRWLRGWPEIVLRLHGNYLEAAGRMNVPANLGTPGAANSRLVSNAGPAIYEVVHTPIVPAASQSVVVTARRHDADAISAFTLYYRVDPATTFTAVTMRDDGASGDVIANDGIFSGTIPGQAANTMVAFYLQATDASAAISKFPADAPTRECAVLFGDTTPPGSFGNYRLWLTQTNVNAWINRPSLSNERIDGTFVYGNWRVIYNTGSKYSGSPYHQGFGSPVSGGCHYSIEMPKDDLLLGTDTFNKIHAPGNGPFDDNTIQREQTAYWMVRTLGLPWNYRRYVAMFVNGVRKGTLMEDTQTPNGDVVAEHFPNDADGQLYKLQPWFEFDDVNVTGGQGAGFANVSWCTLNRYTTTGGAHKLARYRYNYLTRAQKGTANDYTNVFTLVDAANIADNDTFIGTMESLVDMEQWMRTFAVEHAVGNWDSFGANNAQNMYGYKPTDGRWQLFIWDYNIVLGNSGSWGPGSDLFSVNGSDGPMQRIYATPPFRRAYWRALKELCGYAFVNANVDPVMDARHAAFTANGVSVTSPSAAGVKQWIASARSSILAQLNSEGGNTPFAIDGSSYFTATTNLITLTGRAPVEVATITVNGVAWKPSWSNISSWALRLPLLAGSNTLSIVGYDNQGRIVSGASNVVTINYTGPAPSPVGNVVISEIMYNALAPDASFVEIYNRSTNFNFDLSGWRLNGVDFNFPDGTLIAPNRFLVVAKDRDKFGLAYGTTIPVAGEFSGSLDNGGEVLQLIKPGPTNGQDLAVSELRYDDDAPWPAAAAGTGPSLQLIDSAQDNRRVCNWGVGGNGTNSEPKWQYVTVTGTASSSRLYIYLNSAGDVYLDDLKIVAGSVPEVGANMIQNGDFESALAPPWTVSANLSGSAISTSVKRSGAASLHVVSSAGGTTQGSSIWQDTIAMTTGAAYTLSYWYLPSTNGNQLTIRLSGNGIVSTHAIAPPPPTVTALYTPGTNNSVTTNLTIFPPLWLNEVMPNNATNLADRFGHFEPWVELYNSGSNAVNLGGLYLTDNYTNLLQWPFPANVWIHPGQFLTVFCDGAPGESLTNELHTSFRLNSVTGAVALVRSTTSQPQVLDYLNYRLVSAGRTYGSLPDGQPVHRQLFAIPTPGGTNNGTFPAVQVFINEWMAGNSFTIADPEDGDYEDWFELYNAGSTTADLSGYKLTDNLANPGQYTIPSGTTIPAGGFLMVWADGEAGQNSASRPDVHASFKLSVNGEAIGLYDPNTNLVDAVTFAQQTNDVSEGRAPDGFPSPFVWIATPTPGAANPFISSNTAPVLASIGSRIIDEQTLLSFTATAADAETPTANLTFSLDAGAPTGAVISSAGVFTWTPTEAQGPGVYSITVRVIDDGSPAMSDTETITVTVNEANVAPQLGTLTDRAVNEGALASFTATGGDADLPVNTLTFSLDAGAPAGASINSTSGVFTWTPTEAQGPGVYPITVRVTDDGVPALSDFKTFSVTVSENNSAPGLFVPVAQSVRELATLTVTNTATDGDLPAQTLTFAVVAAPAGVALDPLTGVLAWTPTEAQGPSTNTITLRVLDSGTPSLSATQSFVVTVTETNSAPSLTVPASQTLAELATLRVTNMASDADLPAQSLTLALVSAPGGVNLNPTSGVLTWTPTEAQGPSTNTITVRVYDNGTPSLSVTQSFVVTVTESNAAPSLTAPANQTFPELATLTVTNTASDSDVPAQTLTFALVSAPSGVSLNPTSGALTWTPTEAQGPSTNTITVRVFDNGTPSLSVTQSFVVTVTESNSIPSLTVPANQTLAEAATLNVTNTASDADLPAQTLTFALVSSPSGVNLNPTSGALTWTPTEAQGPSTNTITVRVSDNGTPSLSVTQSFVVTVTESNTAPVLAAPGNRTIAELRMLTVTNTATDGDLPAQTLSFALVSAPGGASIDPVTGLFTWTPTEIQGPGTNTIMLRVFDSGTPSLSATQSFLVTVTETNSVPSLTVPAGQVVGELALLTVTNTASDGDLPAQTLTFALVSAPSGVNLNSSSGVLTWTPTESQGPSTNTVTLRVYDNGTPSMSVTQSFVVTVTESNAAPVLTVPGNRTLAELRTLTVTNTATDADLPAQTLSFELVSAPSGVNLNPASGVLTWTPTEEQGPSTNAISVRVFDSGTPSLSVTQSFIVTVTETNSAPSLTDPTDQTLTELTTLTLTNTATDGDDPAQTLTYALVTAPIGMNLDPASGVLTWTPTEAQGPSTNTIRLRVFDNGTPSLSATQTFVVTVTETNALPLLNTAGDQSIVETRTLSVTNTATDGDLPAQTLAFALVSAPSGVNLNPTSGVLTWTPTEAQGPSTNTITLRVFDNGAPSLSVTQSFVVTVTESNSAPALTVPGNRALAELATLTVTNTATDGDLPAQGLAFELVSAPAGVTLDPASGVLNWTPTEAQGPSTNTIRVRAFDDGAPSLSVTQSFVVTVTETNSAPTLIVPANQTLAELTTLTVTNDAVDADLPAQTLTFALVSAPSGVNLNVASGVLTWTPTEAQGPSTNTITLRVFDSGAPSLSVTQSFVVTVTESNTAPVLIGAANQTLAESRTLTVTNTATDADLPAQTLVFELVAAPGGVNLDSASGVLTWTPTEAQGPSTNTIRLRVFDNGTPSLSATQTFVVTVTETNSAPVLAAPGNQTLAELTPLVLTNDAVDADVPAQTLTFALVTAPTGMTLDPATGVLNWTPTEAQGPGTNTVRVRVFDSGTPSLSATQTFVVTVMETNVLPVLTVPSDQMVVEARTLTVTNTATDSDLPAQTLTFALVSAPGGVNLNSSSGVLTWTPTELQGPGTNTITLRVFDSGTPSLSVTQSFVVTVLESNATPTLMVPGNRTLTELQTLTVTNTAGDSDLPAQNLTFALVSAPGGVNLDSSSGVLTWTPTEAQGPGTNTITLRVFDDGAPSLSVTQSFVVTVTETNSAPRLTVPSTQTIRETTTLTVTNAAADDDLPAQVLSFLLVSAPTGVTLDPASGVLNWTPNASQGPGTNTISLRVTDNGTPSLSATQSFVVIVTESNSAPVLTVPVQQTVVELATLTVTNLAVDGDLPEQTLAFGLVSAPDGVNLDSSSGVLTWTPTEAQGPGTNTISVRVFDDGTPSLSVTQSLVVIVVESNAAPTLTVPGNQSIAELATLTITNLAGDADLPAQTLTFEIVSAPAGVSLGSSSGVLTWTPTEAQGPGTNTISVRVIDDGTPSLSVTQSFVITVIETNSAPSLAAISSQTVAELTTLTITNTATDADLPAQTLTFALDAAPSGVALDPATGVLTWIPSEGQGPGTNTITVRVTDNGTPSLSTTQSFVVVVLESNTPPVLDAIPDQIINEGSEVSLVIAASDLDLPAQSLAFALESGVPPGAVIDAGSGVFSWTPPVGHQPATNTITVRVSDNGQPAMGDSQTFRIIVVAAPTLGIEVSSAGVVTLRFATLPGRRYQVSFKNDLGDTEWIDLGGAVTATAVMTTVTDDATGRGHRFYQIRLLD